MMHHRLKGLVVAAACLTGCMIFVPGGGGGNDGGSGVIVAPTLLHAQMLVMVNLDDPSVVQLSDGIAGIISGHQQALIAGTPAIWIDNWAVAPLNQTTTSGPVLIYSENDPPPAIVDGGIDQNISPPSSNGSSNILDGGEAPGSGSNTTALQSGGGSLISNVLQTALNYSYLPTDPNRAVQENVALIGTNIGTMTVYNPAGGNPDQQPVFPAPEDLFIVLTIDHLARNCGPTDANCQLNNQTPMAYFETLDGHNHAQWLNFGAGQGYPLNRVFFVSVATQEGAGSSNIFQRCAAESGFPQAYVDLIEPSPTAYYTPFTAAFSPSSNATDADFCDILSGDATHYINQIATQIANTVSSG